MAIEEIALARQDAADLRSGEAADRPNGFTREVLPILISTPMRSTAPDSRIAAEALPTGR
ncbi:hypothetical protein SAMN04488693_12533 [Arthrobacter subterraneus]|uniref:Uncharacterized protein n=1 Tax=Arthrobacter subterraneus TaxID=335973 RepID=A0A1G8NR63_9MICC|nr:hypothetical protein [Arthrobacter subterraneus]SDI82749.1 hypothetical protein SAMN04488693_12533 [Arthrobacter subterraneus]